MISEVDVTVGSGLKVTCDRDELVATLAVVSRVVSSRGSVQVLSGVLLRPDGDRLELAATDMELSLRTTLAAQVEGDSSVVVPGKLLVDLARLLPASEVTIEYRPDDGVAHISSGTYSSKLNVFAAEDFPRLPVIEPSRHTIATASLLETVDRVAKSASKDESRPVLTGIQVRFEGKKLFMAATDSYRLSFKETELEDRGPGARGDHPRPRSRRAVEDRRRNRDGRARREREHRRLRYGRHVADDAPHRRAVPRRQPLAAGVVRDRGRPPARRAPRRRATGGRDGTPQRATPPPLRRG